MDRKGGIVDAAKKQADRQVPPDAALAVLLNGHVVSRLLYAAAKLGLADVLKDGPVDHERVAEAVGAEPGAVYRVMRTLAGAGVFTEVEKGVFGLTPVGEILRSDVTNSQRALVILMWEPWWRRGWDEMLHSVVTGETAFDRVHGCGLFEYLRKDTEAAKLFGMAMTSFTAKETDAILAAYDFSRVSRIMDLGGGHGLLLSSILKAYKAVRGAVLDLPYVVEQAKAAARPGIDRARCEFMAGDFFERVPPGADCYMLKSVLHDWEDDKARVILKNCRKAMAEGGRLLVIERVMPEGDGPSQAKIMDMVMLVNLGGRERTEGEYVSLLNSSGFNAVRCIPTASPMSIIEAQC